MIAEAKLCQRRSKLWEGICLDSNKCDLQCITRERASAGACHRSGIGLACFCYFNC
ncbi:hypothetical protein RND81_09G038400 [Saponaria officinalis]|uniref:Knottins-like domain-containing protein n=1 Tax=Saponaria officinalis TaxID=3572 RepID=A0AAW1IGM3_SAPOF